MPSDLYSDDEALYSELVLARRLGRLSSSPLSSSLAFDLAAGLDEDTSEAMGGFGFPTLRDRTALTDVVDAALSQEPQLFAVSDITHLQRNLRDQGYLDPSYAITGEWDAASQSALRTQQWDIARQFQQGHGNPLSISAQRGLELLEATMPSGILKTITGMAGEIGRSFLDTFKRWVPLAPGGMVFRLGKGLLEGDVKGFTEDTFDQWRENLTLGHMAEDALNFLTLAGLFVGVSEMALAGRAGLGLAGAEIGKEALGRFGASSLRSAMTLPATEQLLARTPSVAARIPSYFVRKLSPGMADDFTSWVLRFGPRAQAQRPVMRIMGQAYSGLSKATFAPAAAAVLAPDSRYGRARERGVQAPWWVDLSTSVVHPTTGLLLRPRDVGKLFRPALASPRSPWLRLGLPEPEGVTRAAVNVQAYAHHSAIEELSKTKAYQDALKQGGAAVIRLERQALAAERGKALIDKDTFGRRVDPEYWKTAQAWADENPDAIAAYLRQMHATAAERARAGLIGHNPEPDYIEAEQMLNELTHSFQGELPRYNAIAEQINAVTEEMNPLLARWQTGEHSMSLRARIQELQGKLDVLSEKAGRFDVGMLAAADPSLATRIGRGDFRLLVERRDNPFTKQGISDLLNEYRAAASDPRAEQLVRYKLKVIGMSNVDALGDAGKLEDELKQLWHLAPTDVTDVIPKAYADELASRGYKAVVGGENVILRSDVHPYATSSQAGNRGWVNYAWTWLGDQFRAADPSALNRLIRNTSAATLEEALTGSYGHIFKPGAGWQVMRDITDELKSVTDRAYETMKGETLLQRVVSRSKLQFYSASDASIPRLRKIYLDKWVPGDPALADELARMTKRALQTSHAAPDFIESPQQMVGILNRAARAIGTHGLPGAVEAMRAMALSDIKNVRLTTAVGAAGGAVHAILSGQETDEGVPPLAVIGQAAAGALLGKMVGKAVPLRLGQLPPFSKVPDHFGFLPDHLARGALYFRFVLNPFFEAMNYSEQQVVRMAGFELSPVLSPVRKMRQLGITDEAMDIMSRAGFGGGAIDDAERILTRAGPFGFNMRTNAAYDMWRIHRQKVAEFTARGMNATQADDAAIDFLRRDGWKLLSYGPRTPFEKSLNAVFFPFSFQKKYTNMLTDYLTAQPVRTLLVHHTMKLADQLNRSDDQTQTRWSRLVRRYAPVLGQLNRFNALSYGISPGELGGVFRPLAETLGVGAEQIAAVFTPIAVNGDQGPEFLQLAKRLAPFFTQAQGLMEDLTQQLRVATNRNHITEDAEIDDYFTLFGDLKQRTQTLAAIFGTSADNYLRSVEVPEEFKAEYRREELELDAQFPAGARVRRSLINQPVLRRLTVEQLLMKPKKSAAEKAVALLELQKAQLTELAPERFLDPAEKLFHTQLEVSSMRSLALSLLAAHGAAFANLWSALGYEREYGPIAIKELSA